MLTRFRKCLVDAVDGGVMLTAVVVNFYHLAVAPDHERLSDNPFDGHQRFWRYMGPRSRVLHLALGVAALPVTVTLSLACRLATTKK